MREDRGWVGLAVVAVALVLTPLLWEITDFPVFYFVFASGILFWVAQATSWNILSGYSGYFSFGQGAFYGVGVYTMAVLFGRHGWNWLLVTVLGGVLAMLLGLGIGAIAFRLRSLKGEIFALPSFPALMAPFQRFYFLISAVVAMFAVVVSYVLTRNRYGWALFAIRDDETVAEGLGVPTFFHKMVAIGANGLIAGMSGAVVALNLGFVSVEGTFTLRVPLFVIVMSVLGGRNHWAGPLVGAIYLHTLQNRLADAGFDGWSLIVLGGVLVVLMLLAPDGLMARFAKRPWLVIGVLTVVVGGLALWGGWGEPVDWLAAGLAAAAVVGFLPYPRPATQERGWRAGGLGESVALEDDSHVDIASPGRPLVTAIEVAKDFGGVHALRGVSMTVGQGELIGLVGPNGSGKTTLVNLISGSFPPTSGSIIIDGVDIASLQPHRIAHLGIARTYQIPRPFASLSVRDNVAVAIMFGREPVTLTGSRQAAGRYLAMVGLTQLADTFPAEVNLHERQLLEMARAMATRPLVLLLDEALAGLNPAEIDNAVAVVRRIHGSGVSIVLVEHLLRVVNQLATRMVVLDQGRQLAEGEPALVMRDPAVVTAYLGRGAHAAGD